MKKKVIVAGHLCLDITPDFPAKNARQIGDILSPGKLVHLNGAETSLGGAVANTGLAMKLFGCDVCLKGKIGRDAFGTVIADALRREEADEGLIWSDNSSTSFTIALAVPGIDRIFLHSPGANDDFTAEDIDYSEVEEAALFHYGYPTIMRRMFENDGEEMVRMFERIHSMGITTSLDLSAVDADSAAGRADWRKILRRTLPYVDIFVPSVEELLFMLKRERYESLQEEAEGKDMTGFVTREDLHYLARFALDAGVKTVLIKCGAQGLYYCTAAREDMESFCEKHGLDARAWCGKSGFEPSYRQENILSGTGAGDTCIAAFLTAILRQESLEEAIHLAAAAGALCISAYDTLSGLKPYDEMKKMIESGWEKISTCSII